MNTTEAAHTAAPRLVAAIIDRVALPKLEDILSEKQALLHYLFNAMGTASSEILKAFGLSGTEKTVCLCLLDVNASKQFMTAVIERLELSKPGKGIVFSIPMTGISSAVSAAFTKQNEADKQDRPDRLDRIDRIDRLERLADSMDGETEKTGHELVVAVVNQGFSEDVMDAAKETGARGGTIIHARRSDIEDSVMFYGVKLAAEKEIVAILIQKAGKKEMMQAISKRCGMKTEAHGIVLSLPVDSCAGLAL